MDFGEWELKAIRNLAQISVSGTHIRRGLTVVEHLPFQTERAEKSFAKKYMWLERALTQALELKRAMPDKEIQIVFLCMEGLSWR